MNTLREHIRNSLSQRNWVRLFVEFFHWSLLREEAWEIQLGDDCYRVEPIAELAGVKVFAVQAVGNTNLYQAQRQRIARKLQPIAYHALLLFDMPYKLILASLDQDQLLECPLKPGAPSPEQIEALAQLQVPLNESVNLQQVIERIQRIFQFQQRGETVDSVQQALEQLSEAIAEVKAQVGEQFKEVFAHGSESDLERITVLKRYLDTFQDKVKSLRDDWQAIAEQYPEVSQPVKQPRSKPVAQPTVKRKRTRSPHSIPYEYYLSAILDTLEELGGTAHHEKILEGLKKRLGHRLTPWHYETLSEGSIRWENQVEWKYQYGKARGWLRKEPQVRVWSITAAGCEWLRQWKQANPQGW
ncbi:MAG: winged helix-turn-helix domain-containing protein [Fimbriimonadales bacterium]